MSKLKIGIDMDDCLWSLGEAWTSAFHDKLLAGQLSPLISKDTVPGLSRLSPPPLSVINQWDLWPCIVGYYKDKGLCLGDDLKKEFFAVLQAETFWNDYIVLYPDAVEFLRSVFEGGLSKYWDAYIVTSADPKSFYFKTERLKRVSFYTCG